MADSIECAIKVLKIVLHIKPKDEIFCREWAKLSTKEHMLGIRFFTYSQEARPWPIESYGLHKWNSEKSCWNGHGIKLWEGASLREA